MKRGAAGLPATVRRFVVGHARQEAPRECCGFLIGRNGRAEFAFPLPNVARRPTVRFEVDDRHHISVRRWLRRFVPALEIVGIYHSHPSGLARPSAADRTEAHYPEWLFVIVGLARERAATLAMFRIVNGRARRIGKAIRVRV